MGVMGYETTLTNLGSNANSRVGRNKRTQAQSLLSGPVTLLQALLIVSSRREDNPVRGQLKVQGRLDRKGKKRFVRPRITVDKTKLRYSRGKGYISYTSSMAPEPQNKYPCDRTHE
ncbi:hypothetical protein SAMN05216558_0734 [Pseudomonas vancouverensis]|nr:hypothetical protein SAMN05216558_0734 [Pseudomonas vancouverensis]